MRKELAATLEVLVPHLAGKPVDRNPQDDQFRHTGIERVGHAGDLLFERTVHESHLA